MVLPLCYPGLFSHANDRFPSNVKWLDLPLHTDLHLNSCWNQTENRAIFRSAPTLYQSGRNWHHAQAKITFRVCTENKRPNPEVKGRNLALLPPLAPVRPIGHGAVKPGPPGSPGARACAYVTLAPRAHS